MKRIIAIVLLAIAIMMAVVPALAGPVYKCDCGGNLIVVFGPRIYDGEVSDPGVWTSILYMRKQTGYCDKCGRTVDLGYYHWDETIYY